MSAVSDLMLNLYGAVGYTRWESATQENTLLRLSIINGFHGESKTASIKVAMVTKTPPS